VEVRHRKLAQTAVNRIAVAQVGAVRLGNRAPRTAPVEERDHMGNVALIAVHVHDERRLSVNPECAGGDKGALDAVCAPLTQHLAHGEHRLPADLVIDRDCVEKRLDLLWRVESPQDSELAPGKTQIFAAGSSPVPECGHAWRRSYTGGRPNLARKSDRRVCRITSDRECRPRYNCEASA